MFPKKPKTHTSIGPHFANILVLVITLLALTACGGTGGSESFNVNNSASGAGVGGNGGSDDGSDPDVVNGFDLNQAELVLEGPSSVGAGSTNNYTATLLNRNGIPPVSPPGVTIELDLDGKGFTNPPDGDETDRNGEFNFTFTAPDTVGQTVIRARVRNDDDDIVLNEGITVSVRQAVFQFAAPPEDTQLQVGQSRAVQFNWRIDNQGATTGNRSQGNPTAIRFNLSGRPAGGGFRLGNSTTTQSSVVVNSVNGQLAQDVSVVAGDSGGPVSIVATASTNSQSLRAELPLIFVGEPTRIVANPTNIGVPQQGAELLEVQVFDANDTPLSNVQLRFRISICIGNQANNTTDCSSTGERITRELRKTNSAGETTTGFIGGNSNGGGEIEITVDNGPAAGLQRAIVYNVGNGASSSNNNNSGSSTSGNGSTGGKTETFNFPSSGAQIPLGQSQQVVFNVRDNDGPVVGQPVNFTITRGAIDDNPNAAPAPANSRTFNTDGSGDVRFQVFSSEAGLATISGGSTQLDVEFIPTLKSIDIEAAKDTIKPGESNTITATALDSNGDPVQGVQLQFILDANATGGTRAPASGITDEQGEVTTTYTAGTGTGDVSIRAANQSQAIRQSANFTVMTAP